MHRPQQACGEKGTVRYGTVLSEDESPVATSVKGRAHWPLPGQAFIIFLGSNIEGLIIYYIEYCCLQFRYNQRNENNMQTGKVVSWLAPSLEKIHPGFGNYFEDTQ